MKAFNDAASIWRDALHNSSGVSATWRVFAKAHWREDDGTDLTLTAAAVAARMAELYSVASLSWELYLQPLFIFAMHMVKQQQCCDGNVVEGGEGTPY